MGHIEKYCRNDSQFLSVQQVPSSQQATQQGQQRASTSSGSGQTNSSGSGEGLGSQQQGAN